VTNIDKYLFADDKKRVKVYIEMEGIGEHKASLLQYKKNFPICCCCSHVASAFPSIDWKPNETVPSPDHLGSQDNIECTFDTHKFDLVIKGLEEEGSITRLLVDDLHCPIEPEKSKILVKDNKIVVSLFKEIESTWYRLRKGS